MNENRPGEDELIARYFAPMAAPGGLALLDDTALFTPPAGEDLILTQDALIAGIHFFADDLPQKIAQKALRVNLSDLAAKGAAPAGFLLALALPHDWTPHWLETFADGLAADARLYGCPLFGGDTVKTPGPLCLSITAFGLVPRGAMVPRTGIVPGDHLYVTGSIGDAALGLRVRLNRPEDQIWIQALSQSARDFLSERYLLPQPRLALCEALRECAHGGMDVSDGLIGDLSKMMRASLVSGQVELSQIPLSAAAAAALEAAPSVFDVALTGGDDYELLVAVAPQKTARFEAMAAASDIPVTAIAKAREGSGPPTFIGRDGEQRRFSTASYSHF
jgi:thiamine-monophosphate kinase